LRRSWRPSLKGIAELVAFLASNRAASIHGSEYVMDLGATTAPCSWHRLIWGRHPQPFTSITAGTYDGDARIFVDALIDKLFGPEAMAGANHAVAGISVIVLLRESLCLAILEGLLHARI
jgi:hypothetical protein